jgi:methyl-accepting chemotaxis protein
MKLSDLRIGTRLGLGLGTMLLASFLMLVASIVLHQRDKVELAQTRQQADRQQDLALSMRQSLMSAALAVRNMGLHDSTDGVQAAETMAKKERAAYLAAMGQLEGTGLADAQKARLAQVRSIDAAMARDFAEAVDMASQFNTEQAAKLITTRIDPASAKALATLGEFITAQRQLADEESARVEARTLRFEYGLAAAGLLALVVSAFVGWRLSLSIVRPIQSAMGVASQVAAGDLTSSIGATSDDETGRLLGSLQAMTQQLHGMVEQVRASTHSITTASSEIAVGNQELSTRTESTASSLQQAASSLQQMTEMLRQLAGSAATANQLADGAANVARTGGDVVQRVVGTMAEIQASSKRIADITGVIDGIAFQTNILALNAAVEAARAGEQGRGFAVVASEVRSLAQRSAEAAREIKSLIGSSVEKVEAGTQLAADAGKTMHAIVDAVQRVNAVIGEITRAADQQSNGIGEINHAVSQLDQMTQQNAALVEQSAAAAESMKEQSQRLSGLVDTFKLARPRPGVGGARYRSRSTPPDRRATEVSRCPPSFACWPPRWPRCAAPPCWPRPIPTSPSAPWCLLPPAAPPTRSAAPSPRRWRPRWASL